MWQSNVKEKVTNYRLTEHRFLKKKNKKVMATKTNETINLPIQWHLEAYGTFLVACTYSGFQ